MLEFRFHIGDWAKKTAHLTNEERGVYLTLLLRIYDTEQPLPADTQSIHRLACARNANAMQVVSDILDEYFELREDGWHNKRADEEIGRYLEKSEKARKSANARWGAASGDKSAPPKEEKRPPKSAMRSHSEGNANQEPSTNNQSKDPPLKSPPGGKTKRAKSADRKVKMPEPFELTETRADKAISYWRARKRFDLVARVEDEFEQFKARNLAKGERYANWDLAWQTWYANAVKFNPPPLNHHGGTGYETRQQQPRPGAADRVAEGIAGRRRS